MANTATPRRRQREPFWRDLITRQRRSGQSIAAFCRAHGVSQPSFFAWRRRLRWHEDGSAATFVPVQIDLSAPFPHAAPIEIVLRSGTCVRVSDGCDRQTLETVLAALERPPC